MASHRATLRFPADGASQYCDRSTRNHQQSHSRTLQGDTNGAIKPDQGMGAETIHAQIARLDWHLSREPAASRCLLVVG
jgi:hypothetical protein